jgi:hypothetical protein
MTEIGNVGNPEIARSLLTEGLVNNVSRALVSLDEGS